MGTGAEPSGWFAEAPTPWTEAPLDSISPPPAALLGAAIYLAGGKGISCCATERPAHTLRSVFPIGIHTNDHTPQYR